MDSKARWFLVVFVARQERKWREEFREQGVESAGLSMLTFVCVIFFYLRDLITCVESILKDTHFRNRTTTHFSALGETPPLVFNSLKAFTL